MKRTSRVARACILSMVSSGVTVSAANAAATDPGVRSGPGAGGAVAGLTSDQSSLFVAGQQTFAELENLANGLGPRFNLDSCGGCHAYPTPGGSSPPVNPQTSVATAMGARNSVPAFLAVNGPIREVRFKFTPTGARDGGVHSMFVITGRTDATGSAAACTAVQEDFNAQFARGNVSMRIPTPTYGTGLMENIADTTLARNLAADAARKAQLGIHGHLNTEGNDGRVARFGWKAQNVSLLMFAGEAYNVEMGITNELFPTERELNPTCQTAPTPNDVTGHSSLGSVTDMLSDIDKFALFMRFLAAPAPSLTTPGGADSITRGRQAFNDIGCALCHTPAMTTDSTTVASLANQRAALFSDLALHHMGPRLADDIVQGAAGPDEFRTAPLWGLGQRIFFLHDGRTSDLVQAIQSHASGESRDSGDRTADGKSNGGAQLASSEANGVIANYTALSEAARQDILNFLRSL